MLTHPTVAAHIAGIAVRSAASGSTYIYCRNEGCCTYMETEALPASFPVLFTGRPTERTISGWIRTAMVQILGVCTFFFFFFLRVCKQTCHIAFSKNYFFSIHIWFQPYITGHTSMLFVGMWRDSTWARLNVFLAITAEDRIPLHRHAIILPIARTIN